jgi:hypothetical protein
MDKAKIEYGQTNGSDHQDRGTSQREFFKKETLKPSFLVIKKIVVVVGQEECQRKPRDHDEDICQSPLLRHIIKRYP